MPAFWWCKTFDIDDLGTSVYPGSPLLVWLYRFVDMQGCDGALIESDFLGIRIYVMKGGKLAADSGWFESGTDLLFDLYYDNREKFEILKPWVLRHVCGDDRRLLSTMGVKL